MSILDPVPNSDLGTTYTHYGWFEGLVPVYLGDATGSAPVVVERNWVPVWWLHAVIELFGLFCIVAMHLNPLYEPLFPIRVVKPIKAKGRT